MDTVRTPDERFAELPGFDHEPRYVEVDGLRIHHIDTGPSDADPVLLLHGEPTWSYLYRDVITSLTERGHRCVAPDMVGFGRSDKPVEVAAHTYAAHLDWMRGFLDATGLERITLVCQDWGGLLGLRLVAEHPERFARVVASNTGLPTGARPMPEIWQRFAAAVRDADELDVSRLVASGCVRSPASEVLAAYDAPFPDESFKAGPRAMPDLVPNTPDDPQSPANREALAILAELELPILVAFSDPDPITADAAEPMKQRFRGAHDIEHPTIANAGHFVQEDAGAELGRVTADFITATR